MRLSGWGRYPVAECSVLRPRRLAEVPALLSRLPSTIARGNGRSYGDASLNPNATVDTRSLDRLVDFDPITGSVVCEAGVLLAELIDVILPRGWFPPVTPGTKLVTLGGMIASDVHGKNHHVAGSFCDHLEWIDLAIGSDTVLRCSATENSDLYAATCGGMGLTGVILRACFRLLKVESAAVRQRTLRAPTLARAFEIFEESRGCTYSVAWIDCLATGRDLGRSAVLLGEHALPHELPPGRDLSPLSPRPRRAWRMPIDLPHLALSRVPVQVFNRFYYAAQRDREIIVDLDPYFYPLDALSDWNRMYGRRGFIQYQCVLPLATSENGMASLLTEIAASGEASFLAVLKRLGKKSSGMLSFPLEGYTLALDFPATPANLALLERLDQITLKYGGRVYLAKDARLGPHAFAAGYPRLAEFRETRRRYDLDQRFSSLLSRRLEI